MVSNPCVPFHSCKSTKGDFAEIELAHDERGYCVKFYTLLLYIFWQFVSFPEIQICLEFGSQLEYCGFLNIEQSLSLFQVKECELQFLAGPGKAGGWTTKTPL